MDLLMKQRAKPFGLLLWLLLLAASGCGLLGSDPPDKARLRIEGKSGAQSELIVSSDFLSQRQTLFDDSGLVLGDTILVRLFQSDTFTVSLPFERTFDISENNQFFVLIRRFTPEADELWARLWVDGKLRSDRRPAADQDSVTIIYNFRDRPLVVDEDKL